MLSKITQKLYIWKRSANNFISWKKIKSSDGAWIKISRVLKVLYQQSGNLTWLKTVLFILLYYLASPLPPFRYILRVILALSLVYMISNINIIIILNLWETLEAHWVMRFNMRFWGAGVKIYCLSNFTMKYPSDKSNLFDSNKQ